MIKFPSSWVWKIYLPVLAAYWNMFPLVLATRITALIELVSSVAGLHLMAFIGMRYFGFRLVLISHILLSVLKLNTLTHPSLYPHAAIVSSNPNRATISSEFSVRTAFIDSLFFKDTLSIILANKAKKILVVRFNICVHVWSINYKPTQYKNQIINNQIILRNNGFHHPFKKGLIFIHWKL